MGRQEKAAGADALLAALLELGVAGRVADDVIAHYAPDYLWRKVRQTRYARRIGLASHPAGWFVASVRQEWNPPAGFDDWDEMEPAQRSSALAQSWGVCPRCHRRPCHCNDQSDEVEGDDEST